MKKVLSILTLFSALFAEAAPNFVTERIHINQFGYLPGIDKIAVISDPQIGYNSTESYTPGTSLQVRDWTTDEVVFEANIEVWNNGATHDQSGDRIWWFDFSSLTAEGDYYIYDPANDAGSHRFVINSCVYSDLLKQATRVFFYQRCGMEKSAQFAGTAWADGACHLGDHQDTQCYPYDNPNGEMRNLSGGWHDAGDYNKYVNFCFEPVIDLCEALTDYPDVWSDNFGIPESQNSVGDLKDELRYELDWLLKMQNADGGVLCMVGAPDYTTASPPSDDFATRVYGPATTGATLSACAMWARASALYTAPFSTTLRDAAINAWIWANENPDVIFYNSGLIVSGEQQISEYETLSRKLIAAVNLYNATGDIQYRDFVDANYQQAHLIEWGYAYPFEHTLQNALLFYTSIATATPVVADDIKQIYTNSVVTGNEDNLVAFTDHVDAYRAFMRAENYTWGSNTTKSRQGILFQNMLQYNMDPANQQNYEEAALGFVHYFCGVNPNGTCYLTNMGDHGSEKSCKTIYHGWFGDGSDLWDEVGVSQYGPPPGFIQGGVNPTYSLDECCLSDCGSAQNNALCDLNAVSPPLNQPTQKSWKDWNTSWPQNSWTVTEIGIYTQASFIRMLARYVSEGCMTVGVSEKTEPQNMLVVYPNPAEDMLMLRYEGQPRSNTEVLITDASGRILYQEKNAFGADGRKSIAVGQLETGLYFVTLRNSGLTISKPWIKK